MKKRGHFSSEEGEKKGVYLLLTVQKRKKKKKKLLPFAYRGTYRDAYVFLGQSFLFLLKSLSLSLLHYKSCFFPFCSWFLFLAIKKVSFIFAFLSTVREGRSGHRVKIWCRLTPIRSAIPVNRKPTPIP